MEGISKLTWRVEMLIEVIKVNCMARYFDMHPKEEKLNKINNYDNMREWVRNRNHYNRLLFQFHCNNNLIECFKEIMNPPKCN